MGELRFAGVELCKSCTVEGFVTWELRYGVVAVWGSFGVGLLRREGVAL